MENKKKIETITIILLTLLLSIVAVLSMLISMKIYTNAQNKVTENRLNRIVVNYILTKLKCNDKENGITIGKFNDIDAIFLNEDIEGCIYTTVLYVYDGYLRELFCEEDLVDSFAIQSGDTITPADSLKVFLNGRNLEILFTGVTKKEQKISYYIKSGEYRYD